MVQLDNLLKGCKVQRDDDGRVVIQSIRNMDVVFLTTDEEYSLDERFANPLLVTATNRNYGHLQLQNPEAQEMIVAPQVAVFKQRAQNHALPKSAYLPPQSSVDYDDAGCVQGSAGGTISGGEVDVRFVPVSIREMLLDNVNNTSGHSTLYKSVQTLGTKTGVHTGDYIDKYYTKYDPELTEFIAHFERPAQTIGVIVLIDNEIVAVDKFPSFTYTAQVWDMLIRDCYGSLAIESMQKDAEHTHDFDRAFVETPEVEGETPVMFLRTVLANVLSARETRVVDRIKELMDVEFEVGADINSLDRNDCQSHTLKAGDQYIGQVIESAGEYYHLVSIVKRDKFNPEAVRATLRATREYREKAAEQRQFTI
jgi:hypothetical protein